MRNKKDIEKQMGSGEQQLAVDSTNLDYKEFLECLVKVACLGRDYLENGLG